VLIGLIRAIAARAAGRTGPPPLQLWRDLLRLLRKQPVLAENASPLFEAAPTVCVAAIGTAALLVPSFTLGMLTAPLADLIVIIGLLALARAALALAAMDAGTAPGGIGASRTAMLGAFAEPGLLLVVLILALITGSTNLDTIAATLREAPYGLHASLIVALLAAGLIGLAETGFMPLDDPEARSDPAMVRQAVALDYSGRHLALVEFAAALRLLLWLDLIIAAFVPFGMAPAESGPLAWVIGFGAWLLKILLLAAVLAALATGITRMRLFRVPDLLGIAAILGLLAAVLLFVTASAA
jgi:formate hydrogenlyase subunit 4